MGIERRKFLRVPVYMKIINESKEFNFGFSYAKDLSVGGIALDTKIFFEGSKELKLGDTLKLKFKIPGGKLYITADGEVTRIDKTGGSTLMIGLKFMSIDDKFKKEIEDFVRETRKGNLILE